MSKINWKSYLLEFLTVVFSILMAFGLNNWNENNKERAAAMKYLEGIKQEVQLNLKEVAEKLDYHTELNENLRKDPLKVNLILKSSKLKNYAWRVAENSALKKYAGNELYLKILELYSMQEHLTEHSKNASEMMSYLNIVGPYHLTNLPDSEEEQMTFFRIAKQGWISIFEDTIYYEGELKRMYSEILEEL